MRDIRRGKFPDPPWVPVVTCEYIKQGEPFSWADFKDTHAIYHSKSGRFVGCSHLGILTLGKKELKMVDGLWIMEADEEVIKSFSKISLKDFTLSIIE